MILNFVVALTVMKFTKKPPQEIQDMVEDIRIPRKIRASDKVDSEE